MHTQTNNLQTQVVWLWIYVDISVKMNIMTAAMPSKYNFLQIFFQYETGKQD
jgi:hypothetical protein